MRSITTTLRVALALAAGALLAVGCGDEGFPDLAIEVETEQDDS